ncbi:MAG TPA: pyruvate flavodoxin/ferredoxin oxidoreductase [Candidatus Marinimicrobia bacterium]|jgi:2-oxoglutarate ferredoxin oxidoreductase subunit alpha|nr:pyruvate flavodoxin/ferredoxin oxidoreductase [Candidatus Neomarinimicrobiota bacterium]
MNNQRREMVDGASAIARGALDAGCNYFAGYPITPASGILSHMLRELPKVGGIGFQGEDEISSLGHCIGAAMAGATVFTATSGPGLSLYSENLGLAIMMEVPIVIAISQRLGPSTGAATASAQGDIQFMRWGTTGGYPMIVLSPTNISESYHLTKRAFKLAKRFRTPVFLASDKDTVMTTESVSVDAMKHAPDWPEIPNGIIKKALDPYRVDGPIHHYTGSSHNDDGHITKDPDIIATLNERLRMKIESNLDELSLVKSDLEAGADTLMVSYGVSARSMDAAVNKIRNAGNKVSSMTIYSLWPIPEKTIQDCLTGIKRVIVPEMNHGQYLREIERLVNRDIELIGVNRVDTILITPEEIIGAYHGR